VDAGSSENQMQLSKNRRRQAWIFIKNCGWVGMKAGEVIYPTKILPCPRKEDNHGIDSVCRECPGSFVSQELERRQLKLDKTHLVGKMHDGYCLASDVLRVRKATEKEVEEWQQRKIT
jgi:hypothetical protein